MGVRGLTSYVNLLPRGRGRVWEEYNLSNTSLVIDGNGLSYHIYKDLDCRFGGQYRELEERVRSFFTKLKKHDVLPYVVFDGILDESDKKLETILERKNNRIGKAYDLWKCAGYDRSSMVLPRLAQQALMTTLREIGVSYAVADFEADNDIVFLANQLCAPVMGQDSDYFIFDIKHGYIPFDQYDLSGPNTKVLRFHSDRLAKHLNITSSMLPLLASLLGNDYVSNEMLSSFKAKMGRPSVDSVAKYLSSKKSQDDAKAAIIATFPESERRQFQKVLNLSVEEYHIRPSYLLGYFKRSQALSSLKTYNRHPLPTWLVKLFRSGTFEECVSCLCQRKLFLKVQVEDMRKTSANECTKQIRHFLYKLLAAYDQWLDGLPSDDKQVVTEYDREASSLKKYKMKIARATIGISEIQAMDKAARTACLFNALSCDLKFVRHLPLEWQLVVVALRYWITNATPPVTNEHILALLVYCIGERNDPGSKQQYAPDVGPLQGFAQWQNIIYWVNNLNSMFSNVLPPLKPARLYDGRHVCKLYNKIKFHGKEAAKTSVIDGLLFQQLYDAVLRDLHRDKFEQSQAAKMTKAKKPKEMKPAKTTYPFLSPNLFAKLQISSDSEED